MDHYVKISVEEYNRLRDAEKYEIEEYRGMIDELEEKPEEAMSAVCIVNIDNIYKEEITVKSDDYYIPHPKYEREVKRKVFNENSELFKFFNDHFKKIESKDAEIESLNQKINRLESSMVYKFFDFFRIGG